jgi:hypothetical protein
MTRVQSQGKAGSSKWIGSLCNVAEPENDLTLSLELIFVSRGGEIVGGRRTRWYLKERMLKRMGIHSYIHL